MAIAKNLQVSDFDTFEGGCNYSSDISSLKSSESPNSMNVIFKKDFTRKRGGYDDMRVTTLADDAIGRSLTDLGVTGLDKRLVAHFDETVYLMDNLDGVLTPIRNSAPDIRSFNTEVKRKLVQTYDDNSAEYYWDGESASMTRLSVDAPGFKHAIEAQGYMLAGNIIGERLRIYYEDVNTIVDGAYADYFTLTGGRDDELTGFVTINGRTFAHTKEKIFRLSYIGGVAVWDYREIVSSTGVVPGTLKVVISDEFGEIAIFLGYDRHLYLFDGSFVKKLSRKFYVSNLDTAIALDQIDGELIENASAVYDSIEDVYRLVVTRKSDETNYFMLNIDVETLNYYPFDNMIFSCMHVATDNQGRRVLLGAGYNGKIYKLFIDINHDDGLEIVEYYESPLAIPVSQIIKKGEALNLLFEPVGHYKVTIKDKSDYDRDWNTRNRLDMFESRDRFLGLTGALGTTLRLGSDVEGLLHPLNIPTSVNAYRFRIDTGGVAGRYVCYRTGTVSGSAGGTVLTGVGTNWPDYLLAENDFFIWIKSGIHKNYLYTFNRVSATSAVVSMLNGTAPTDNFASAEYEIFRRNHAPSGKRWQLNKVSVSSQGIAYGKAEAIR